MNNLEKIFAQKETENGDVAYTTTGSNLLDLFFMTEYFEKHIEEVKIGKTIKDQLFSMFIRDGRFGLGRRDLGRELMKQSGVSPQCVVAAGRFDDLYQNPTAENIEFLREQVFKGNDLAKKWCPRLNSKDRKIAKELAKKWFFGARNIAEAEKLYRKLIKSDTVENKLSRHRIDEVEFEKVPSLAMLKYYARFMKEERFQKYIEAVKSGEKKLNISTTTVYDIYRNRDKIDADLFFDKLEKIKINCVPILDTSGSMWDGNDSIGKAISIAHYLGKCSTYCPNQVVSFSSQPRLITIDPNFPAEKRTSYYSVPYQFGGQNKYCRELSSLYTGDCSNTNFGKVMQLFSNLKEAPEYLVVLSDMEFDEGSSMSKDRTMKLFKDNGFKTKIVWWNFNARNKTVPETDDYGNIYLSGYSPYLLKFLDAGFDGHKFLDKLLLEYKKEVFKED